MGRERTLLERIANRFGSARGGHQPTSVENVDLLMESVRQHLVRLLNSRECMSECAPDYGLPALSDLTVGTGDHARTVQDALQATIEKYEPRLRGVRVARIVDEDHGRTLAFRVDAVLVGRSGEHKVWYETSLQGSGQFEVSG